MRRTTFFRILLYITCVGNIGLMKFDSTGLTQEHGLFNLQSLTRIVVYLGIGFSAFIISLAYPACRSLGNFDSESNGAYLRFSEFKWVLILFLLFLLSIGYAFSLSEKLIIVYRVAEWGLVLYLITQAFPYGKKWHPLKFEEELIGFLKLYVSIPILIVLVGTIFMPSFAIELGGNAGFRLGGRLVLPTTLAVLSGIGFVLFWNTAQYRWERAWAVGLLLITLATQTRGGVLGLFMAIALVFFLFGSRKQKLAGFVLAPVVFMGVMVFDFSQISQFGTQLLLRGGDYEALLTLNSRLNVWSAAIAMIIESPLLGHGYIIGPKSLSNYMSQHWWVAPQAHNDILNSAVSSGVFAAVVVFGVYVGAFFKLFRLAICRLNAHKALMGAFFQIVVFSTLAPILSTTVSPIGIVLLILIYVSGGLVSRHYKSSGIERV